MEPPSSPSSTITAPPDYHDTSRRLGKLIAEAITCRFALLHYDSTSKSMIEWYWPADGDGKRILPPDLERYPCCLCADGGGRKAYVEAAVYSWWNKIDKNTDWIARCTLDICGYRDVVFGHLPVPSKSTTASLMDDEEHPVLPIEFVWNYREQTELLNKLDSSDGDGIPERKFRILFKRCKKCKRVGVRPVINHHICSGGVQKHRRNRLMQ
ncbi:hypothetical protein DEU56DRAFT_758785 [Suillus clintonianus]|uniref:uncharacterized protein n=1 Tax=Suillus clintonianus TaxID=1904413 RepID=UPI001B8759EE|nr:uncharacterized protein DEU56DRAFT_758785 [Suillus clintonianus]KAG2126801.1 hypothetical protein DEU56DRAFT_758785 [Suillus clintonianus]